MKVIIVKTDNTYQITDIDDKLETMQKIVGGYIELVRIAYPLFMVVNEEGLIRDLPNNKLASGFYPGMYGVAGDVFFIAMNPDANPLDEDTNEFADLDPRLIDLIVAQIENMGGQRTDG